MATILRIPPRYQPGLRAIEGMEQSQVESLRDALVGVPADLTTSRLVARVVEAVPELEDDATDVVEALLSLVALLEDDLDAAPQLSKDVSEAEDLGLPVDRQNAYAARLLELMRLDTITVAARAHDVMTEHDKAFHDARILTDIRPVFGADPDQRPSAAVILDVLKIEYHRSDGTLDAVRFALDRADLVLLKTVVDRALAKTDTMRGLLADVGLSHWEYVEVSNSAGS